MESICANYDVTSGVRPSTEVPSSPSTCNSPHPARFFLQCHYRADATYGHTVTPFTDRGHTSTPFKDYGHTVTPLATDQIVQIAGSHCPTDHQMAGSSSCWTHASPESASSQWRTAVYVDRKDLQPAGGSHVTGLSEANAGLEAFQTVTANCSTGRKGRVEQGTAQNPQMDTTTSDSSKKPDVVFVPRATTDDAPADRIYGCTNKPEMTQPSRKARMTSLSGAPKSESLTDSSNDSSVRTSA